jgi:hypothetical protein
MKKLILFFLVTLSLKSFGQETHNQDKKEILQKVQQFFDALEKQDTILFKSILLTNGQVWAISEKENDVLFSVRTFKL